MIEVEYRLNVATQFQEQDRLKKVIFEIKKNLSYLAVTAQHYRINELRLKWLNEGLPTSEFLRQVISYAVSESSDVFNEETLKASIQAVKLFEQEMQPKMKWTIGGQQVAKAIKCRDIFRVTLKN